MLGCYIDMRIVHGISRTHLSRVGQGIVLTTLSKLLTMFLLKA